MDEKRFGWREVVAGEWHAAVQLDEATVVHAKATVDRGEGYAWSILWPDGGYGVGTERVFFDVVERVQILFDEWLAEQKR
jgi:hypothetical protein